MSARQWKPGHFCVVEAVNQDRREILVAVTVEDFEASVRGRPDLLPPAWSMGERVEFREVERDLSLHEAAEFALRYSESESLKPFRVYLGGMALPPELAAGDAASDDASFA